LNRDEFERLEPRLELFMKELGGRKWVGKEKRRKGAKEQRRKERKERRKERKK